MASKRHDLAQVLAHRVSGDQSKLAKEIAAFLLETNQVSQLESLLRDVRAIHEGEGHIEADVSLAHDVTPEVLNEVKQIIKRAKPHAKTVVVHPIHDTDVIGGLKVRLSNEQLDMTVRAQLDTFKRLTEGVN